MALVNNTSQNIKKRTTKEKFRIYHKLNIRSGLYRFLGQNFMKLVLFLVGIVVLIFFIDLIFDLEQQQINFERFVEKHHPLSVFAIFFATETILGLIPPDIFLVWAKTRFPENTYVIVTILSTLSYAGGLVAYKLGSLIRNFPSVRKFVEKKYEKNFILIEKWGGLIIVMAALFPLPYAIFCTIAGIARFPFKSFMLFSLTRYIRFFLHALIIFGALKEYL